jgi:hypothetical protein
LEAYRVITFYNIFFKLNLVLVIVFLFSVTEVKENCEYRVDFTSGGNQLSLLVILGPDFPLEKPVLKILPIVQHPWVSENGEVTGAPGLLNVGFSYKRG